MIYLRFQNEHIHCTDQLNDDWLYSRTTFLLFFLSLKRNKYNESLLILIILYFYFKRKVVIAIKTKTKYTMRWMRVIKKNSRNILLNILLNYNLQGPHPMTSPYKKPNLIFKLNTSIQSYLVLHYYTVPFSKVQYVTKYLIHK